MEIFNATKYPYKIIKEAKGQHIKPFPLLRDSDGNEKMCCVSPHHGRSFVVGNTADGMFVVSKGNGLSYSQYQYLYSAEYNDYTWGVLLVNEAVRDFTMGVHISELGIKTNIMNYVLELDTHITLTNGHTITPVLLQYLVECPYRICDAAYMPIGEITKQVNKWKQRNTCSYNKSYLIAANVLINNLAKLHSHGVLHNAIHIQNYTWALELLDFELACSPELPYDKIEDRSRANDLFNREIIQTYEIIKHIAWCLREEIDYMKIDALFAQYGFDLSFIAVH